MASLAGVMTQAFADPTNVRVQIRAADACYKEREFGKAAGFYDAAWELGLPLFGRLEFYFHYGATLREEGRLEESEKFLIQGIVEFPYDKALPVYLAYTLHKGGRDAEALAILFELLIDLRNLVTDMAQHKPEITRYLDEMLAEAGAAQRIEKE